MCGFKNYDLHTMTNVQINRKPTNLDLSADLTPIFLKAVNIAKPVTAKSKNEQCKHRKNESFDGQEKYAVKIHSGSSVISPRRETALHEKQRRIVQLESMNA